MIFRVIPFIFLSSFFTANAQEPTPEQKVMIDEIFAGFKAAVAPPASPGDPVKRPVFGKDHGCLRAKFTVSPTIPRDMRLGIFQRFNVSYDAWIRFANDGAAAKPDGEPAARGMAIKLVGIPGKKILEGYEDALTQDFVMQNHPRFFVDDLKGFRDLIVMPPQEFHKAHPETMPIFNEMDKNEMSNPLHGTYWTPVPYKFGSKVIKYMAEPCTPPRATPITALNSDNFLRENLIQHNRYSDSCFKFKVQFQTNEAEMPVDRATVLWDPAKSPFIEVATIEIKAGQSVDAPSRVHSCENLSMTGWHSLPEHAPLGSINLARKFVYKDIAKYRRDRNGVPQKEPGVIGPNQ